MIPIKTTLLAGSLALLAACSPRVNAAPDPYLSLIPTSEVNRFGNPVLLVQMHKEGKIVSSVPAVSGRGHTQERDRHVAGTEAPLPNGRYSVAPYVVSAYHPELGDRFVEIEPLFPTQRSLLGFHLDPSYNKDPVKDGTAGCIGLTTKKDRETLFLFIQKNQPTHLEVQL